MSRPEDRDLIMARRHLVEGEARIVAQRRLINRLADTGQPTDLAEQLLASLEDTIAQMQVHYEYLKAARDPP